MGYLKKYKSKFPLISVEANAIKRRRITLENNLRHGFFFTLGYICLYSLYKRYIPTSAKIQRTRIGKKTNSMLKTNRNEKNRSVIFFAIPTNRSLINPSIYYTNPFQVQQKGISKENEMAPCFSSCKGMLPFSDSVL